ncbi:MAG: ribonuclease J, partial [Patescibacteria group bacterium]|nr:ribonuclease J [Patescibacteria group bacterium]
MKKTKQTRQSTAKSSSTGRVISRTAQKNAQKARDNAKKSNVHKSGAKKTTSSSTKTKTTTSKKVANKKSVAKKSVKKSTKKATKKHGKKRGGGRRQGPKTNAERIISSTQSNGEQRNAKIPKTAKDTLRIIPMGGQEEVGRNMVIFEYGKDIVIVDMGMQFPEEDMPGIDYIVPNANYLKGKEQNIRGVIFTHGHLDHIGAAPVLLKELGYPPVIARDLTLALIKKKLEDGDPGGSDRISTISVKNIDRKIRLGDFVANFFEVEHSIMDSMGVALVTPVGTAIHLGDWTISHDPADGNRVSYEKLKDFPAPRILMLESLGVMKKEVSSEKEVQVNLETLIREAQGRIILGTFASQIKR